MIDKAYCLTMARYNAWQNDQLMRVLDDMDDAALRADRGAFFGSIFATLNHLLWADQIWLSRFERRPPPAGGIAESVALQPTLAAWSAERFRMDGRITLWAERLDNVALQGDLVWYSGATGREMRRPMALCVTHFFNHQTHHRGQIHAMLTAAGVDAPVSDLVFMPEPAEAV